MIGICSLSLFLFISRVASSEFPDFGDDSEGYDDRYVCEGDACADRHTFIYVDKDVKVPNRSVTYEESAYFNVDTAGLLADCAPSLSVGDIATDMKSCREVDYKYRKACVYRKKGWLDKDGKTVKEGLDKDFKEIDRTSENIMKCSGWDGVSEYDYNYNDYYDYYYHDYYNYVYDDYLEESNDIQVRKKRSDISNIPEFMIQNNRKKRSIRDNENNGSKKSIIRKGHSAGDRGTHRRKVGKKSKNKNMKNRKSKKEGKKLSRINGKWAKQPRKQSRKSGKKSKMTGKRSGKAKKSGKRSGKTKKTGKRLGKSKKKKHRSGKKGNEKKKKEEKKRKKREKKILKEIGYDSEPSKETLNKLKCAERAIMYGLEKCGEKIFKKPDIPMA